MATHKDIIIQSLLSDTNKLLQKLPFTRGCGDYGVEDPNNGQETSLNQTRIAVIPNIKKTIITQDKFLKELDPMCHEILFDNNIPSICVKLRDGGFNELEFKRMPIALQERIASKKTLSLCGNKMTFTLLDKKPNDMMKNDFTTFKQYWDERNQDGMKTKMVYTQMTQGDAGMLYYFDYDGRIKSRLLTYADGYVLIPHNDANGDRILESVYYQDANGVQYIDSYDDTYFYRMTNGLYKGMEGEWVSEKPIAHGFSEIPLITKRGDVAWNNVQSLIEVFEIIYNIFIVIQKRHGWGILYIKGKFSEQAQQIAGSIILNDTSMDGKGSAEFKTPPSPTGTIETLQDMFDKIQIGSSCTFLLPKDVKSSGDISALAIMLTQSLDIEEAAKNVIEWQNVADKMCRLFKEGLAKELVNKKINPTAITDFANLHIGAKFKTWRPFNEHDYNQMLMEMKSNGILSTKTAIEKNTVSTPDEEMRLETETEKKQKQESSNTQTANNTNTDNNTNGNNNNVG